MKKRTKLSDRTLPPYTRGEEIMNMVTHIVGGGIGVITLVLCVIAAALRGNVYGVVGSAIFGGSMIATYCLSSVYHGLRPGLGKKVLQVLDHCTIYTLIAGTYTVITLSTLRPLYPGLGWGMFGFQWGLAAICIVLNAIDLKKYNVFSYICYILMGWAILPFMSQARDVLTNQGFLLLLFGGISFSIGAVLFCFGSKKRWMHPVFHIFVVLGSILQSLCVLFYAL